MLQYQNDAFGPCTGANRAALLRSQDDDKALDLITTSCKTGFGHPPRLRLMSPEHCKHSRRNSGCSGEGFSGNVQEESTRLRDEVEISLVLLTGLYI